MFHTCSPDIYMFNEEHVNFAYGVFSVAICIGFNLNAELYAPFSFSCKSNL